MRKYTAKIELIEKEFDTGMLGEFIFKNWFENNFNGEVLHKQSKDRDFEGVDFACNKGYTYQVKATIAKTYTFNCSLENLPDKLTCDFYVFIQIKDDYAYIEGIYKKDYVLDNAKSSYHYENTFLWAKDLQLDKVNADQLKLL